MVFLISVLSSKNINSLVDILPQNEHSASDNHKHIVGKKTPTWRFSKWNIFSLLIKSSFGCILCELKLVMQMKLKYFQYEDFWLISFLYYLFVIIHLHIIPFCSIFRFHLFKNIKKMTKKKMSKSKCEKQISYTTFRHFPIH